MGFTVEPDHLLAAGKEVAAAAGELGGCGPAARQAETHASEIHYQPAAGMAEAVAQKAGANLTLMKAVLDGLNTGLGNAAVSYRKTDRLGTGPR